MGGVSRYLRVQDLRRLRNVFFASKRVVDGQYAGRHASPQRGHSVEFSDYREYYPGDEIGDIDWKVYGRSDRFYVKLFEHQSDMTVNLVIDGSASMAYQAGNRESKFDHAARLAASIAFLTTKQQDAVSLAVAQGGLKHYLRPLGAFKHLQAVLKQLESVELAGEAQLADTLHDVGRQLKRKGLVVLFSDLLENDQNILKALSAFTHRGSEVIVFHVLDADELQLPDMAEAVFIDSETHTKLRLNVDDVRHSYRDRVRRFIRGWRTSLRARGIDYRLVSTAEPYHQALEDYLFSRATLA